MFDVDLYKELQIAVLPLEMEKLRLSVSGALAWETKAQRAERAAKMKKAEKFTPTPPTTATDGSTLLVWPALKYPTDEHGVPVPENTCANKYKSDSGWRSAPACANLHHCRRSYLPAHANVAMEWSDGRFVPRSRWNDQLSDNLFRNGVGDMTATGITDPKRPATLMERLEAYKYYKGVGETHDFDADMHERAVALMTGIPMTAGTSGVVVDMTQDDRMIRKDAECGQVRMVCVATRYYETKFCSDRMSTFWINRAKSRMFLNKWEVEAHSLWLKHVCGSNNKRAREQLLRYIGKVKTAHRPHNVCKVTFKAMQLRLRMEAKLAWNRKKEQS